MFIYSFSGTVTFSRDYLTWLESFSNRLAEVNESSVKRAVTNFPTLCLRGFIHKTTPEAKLTKIKARLCVILPLFYFTPFSPTHEQIEYYKFETSIARRLDTTGLHHSRMHAETMYGRHNDGTMEINLCGCWCCVSFCLCCLVHYTKLQFMCICCFFSFI